MRRLIVLILFLLPAISFAADNVAITAGAGTTIAADEVTDGTLGTVKVQEIKVMDGTIDGTNKLVITAGGAAKIDGSAVTQPISGNVGHIGISTITFNGISQPVSQTGIWGATVTFNGSQSVKVQDNSGNGITSTANALDVNIKSGGAAGGTASNYGSSFPSQGTAAGFLNSSGNMQGAKVDISSNIVVTALINGSSNTVQVSGTVAVNSTPVGTSTVTFNNVPQPITVQNTSTITFNNTGQPVYNQIDKVYIGTTSFSVQYASVSVSANGYNILISTVAGHKITVIGWDLNTGTATNIKFQSTAAPTDLTGLYYLAANGGVARECGHGCFQTNSGEGLALNLSAGNTVGGVVQYVAGP